MAGLDGLDPDFLPYAQGWVDFLRSIDARFVVTSGFRTRAAQVALYSRMLADRAAGLPVYTTLPPGQSLHERGLAIDMVRMGVDARDDELLHEAGAVWRSLGGTWGGDADPVHFGAPRSWW
jgi:D-alanyl-D-alanine carboxypeptidase